LKEKKKRYKSKKKSIRKITTEEEMEIVKEKEKYGNYDAKNNDEDDCDDDLSESFIAAMDSEKRKEKFTLKQKEKLVLKDKKNYVVNMKSTFEIIPSLNANIELVVTGDTRIKDRMSAKMSDITPTVTAKSFALGKRGWSGKDCDYKRSKKNKWLNKKVGRAAPFFKCSR